MPAQERRSPILHMDTAGSGRHPDLRRGRLPPGLAGLRCDPPDRDPCLHPPTDCAGITLIAVGEDPRTVERARLSVATVRFAAVLTTGLMAALAGTFLSIGDIHTFTEGMTNGAGYLAIAAVIFGNWTVSRTVLACFLFGAATALQFQLPAMGIVVPNALLVMLPYLLAFLAVAGLVVVRLLPGLLRCRFTADRRNGSRSFAQNTASIIFQMAWTLVDEFCLARPGRSELAPGVMNSAEVEDFGSHRNLLLGARVR